MDGLGNPVRLLLTGGEAADITQAQALIAGFDALRLWLTRDTTPTRLSSALRLETQRRSSPAEKTALSGENTITMFTKTATLLNDFSIVSSSSGDW